MRIAALPPYLHAFSLSTPFPVGPVNVYLAEGAPLTLVDTGPRCGPAREELEQALAGCGYRVTDLRRIVITHAHADHCGLAAELVRASGAEVLTHAANLSRLADGGGAQRLAFYGEAMRWAGVPVEVMMDLARMRRDIGRYAEPVAADRTLADGDLLQLGGEGWQVLHTPGHTGGLICLYQPQRRLLLSSDHLLRDISSNPIVEPPAQGETERPRRLVEYMAQLRRVAELDVALALPGHGPPISDHRALIRERLAFHEERARHVLEILGDEAPSPMKKGSKAAPSPIKKDSEAALTCVKDSEAALTVNEIVSQLFSGLDPINHFLAISEVIGHLQWLEVEGRVMRDEQDGVARWQRME